MSKKSIPTLFLNFETVPRWVVMVIDVIISLAALVLAYFVRFDFYTDSELIKQEWGFIKEVLPFIVILKFAVFYFFKIHKGLIRHTSLEDVKRIFFALLTFSLILAFTSFIRKFYFDERYVLPTSVLVVEFLASLLFLIGFRFSIKVLYYEFHKPKTEDRKNVIIYGSGVSGLITKRTIEKDPSIGVKIIGFVDDNKKLKGSRLEGAKIYHSSKLKCLIDKHEINELIVAIQNPINKNVNQIIETCLEKNVEIKKVPSFKRWIDGEFQLNQIRKINIDDLLGRDPISLKVEAVKSELKDQIILITGAAGSIGSGIVRQVVNYSPKKVILLDQWESGLYDLRIDLISKELNQNVEVVIGDVRDKARMEKLFKTYTPTIVFHAAAYKHVPLMEANPSESIKTNVLGTKTIVDLSDKYKVVKMVMISTDKAVNPTNVMGASKRIAEIYAQAINEKSTTQYVTTRFGNVLGSNGSVIPLFKRQIDEGGPVTVTNEHVTRYFMTIPEACQLVLEAGAMGKGGEIYVFDMGKPIKIVDLAKKMIRLSGLELEKDIEIKITGLRPGEKLYEELLADTENTLPTHHPKIMKGSVTASSSTKLKLIEELILLFDQQDNQAIVKLMKQIVPEFKSNNSEYSKLD
ncbi:polysaccharide biosynthesis protein [Brumimicrobium salinarum]|uniref:Polysaccharide biosynthesis protein n=1 Tax=Brumimicrobium salinarum TaxID=2058658 RepID=A0A2I0R510_9FLAO|nr:nucleoside-diphosphate sugar epimerase/dehydratase [Brumimicrobium salinarum]PKR81645.1 polysaccharide biosynthesis protein [Brumimicrobium salinarum]